MKLIGEGNSFWIQRLELVVMLPRISLVADRDDGLVAFAELSDEVELEKVVDIPAQDLAGTAARNSQKVVELVMIDVHLAATEDPAVDLVRRRADSLNRAAKVAISDWIVAVLLTISRHDNLRGGYRVALHPVLENLLLDLIVFILSDLLDDFFLVLAESRVHERVGAEHGRVPAEPDLVRADDACDRAAAYDPGGNIELPGSLDDYDMSEADVTNLNVFGIIRYTVKVEILLLLRLGQALASFRSRLDRKGRCCDDADDGRAGEDRR